MTRKERADYLAKKKQDAKEAKKKPPRTATRPLQQRPPIPASRPTPPKRRSRSPGSRLSPNLPSVGLRPALFLPANPRHAKGRPGSPGRPRATNRFFTSRSRCAAAGCRRPVPPQSPDRHPPAAALRPPPPLCPPAACSPGRSGAASSAGAEASLRHSCSC